MVRPAPTSPVCACTPSSAAAYCRRKSSDQGMPVRYLVTPPLRNRTRRLPCRSVFQLQCLGGLVRVRSMDFVPRILGGLFGGQDADRGPVLGYHLNATDREPSGLGAAHGAGHITLLEEVATTTDY